MALINGTRLGPYEIVAPLGAGGMGEVYRAQDTRLGREVALKVLPAEVADDPSRRERFESEARAIAALNHPNIVAVYDVGQSVPSASDGKKPVSYIVTELVEGETLRGRKFGTRKAIEIAVQIANGLAAAHNRGIVHRDLKPDNVMLTRDGHVKILDFGLAKPSGAKLASAAMATVLTTPTEPGVVLGTVGYMSPEQVRGEGADSRSDIFSFGVLLHEMLTGERVFQGNTSVETMTAILNQEAPELPETVAPGIQQIVRHCLEKSPENRFQSARDLSYALSAISQSGSKSGVAQAVVEPIPWIRYALTAATVIALVLLALGTYRLIWRQPATQSWSAAILGGPDIAFDPRPSPDGSLIAFLELENGFTQVALMQPSNGNWSMLTHDRDHGIVGNVCWSADGATIFYDRVTSTPQGIYSIPVLGGEAHLVLDNAFRPAALPDGTLLAVRLNKDHQWQLIHFWPETGKIREYPIFTPSLDQSIGDLRVVPGGKEAVLLGVVAGEESKGMHLMAVDVETGAARTLLPDDIGTPSWAITRDGTTLLVGENQRSFSQVIAVPLRGKAAPRQLFTSTGEIWYIDSGPDNAMFVNVVQRPVDVVRGTVGSAKAESVATFSGLVDSEIAVLPDGRVVASVLYSGRSHLVALQSGKNPVNLVATTDETSGPMAMVGDRQIAFMLGPPPHQTIAIADIQTGYISRKIETDKGEVISLAASPDGKTLYFAAAGSVWSIPIAGGKPRFIRAGSALITDPMGKDILVAVFESPRPRVFRVPLDGGPEREVVSEGAIPPFYGFAATGSLSADGRLLANSNQTWFNLPVVVDTNTGRVTQLPVEPGYDYHYPVWLPNGQYMVLRAGISSTLWKYTASKN